MKITSTNAGSHLDPGTLSIEQKVHGNVTKYAPIIMNDKTVYDFARRWCTQQEIADMFSVSRQTLMDLHGAAFHAGKNVGMMKPRMLLDRIMDDFLEDDPVTGAKLNFARPDVPTGTALKAIELHARKYEGLGKEQPVEAQAKPSVGEVKFDPLEGSE